MAWTATVVNVTRDNALASVVVDFSNGAETRRQTYRISDVTALKIQVANQIAAYTAIDTLVATPPLGALDVSQPVPTPPTPAEIAAAAARNNFSDDLRTLRQLTASVTLGILPANTPQIATLQSSLNTRLTNNPGFFLPLIA